MMGPPALRGLSRLSHAASAPTRHLSTIRASLAGAGPARPSPALSPFRIPTTAAPAGAFLSAASAAARLSLVGGQRRGVSMLAELENAPGSVHKKIRRGRGPSSGKGKTSGRGHKGQKARGGVPAGFQGGQTPLELARPPRGKGNENLQSNLAIVNLGRVQEWINNGRLQPGAPITVAELVKSRCIHQAKEGVKLLGTGRLTSQINITVSRASASAIAAVEAAGGTVTTRYYSKFAIGEILKGTMHPTVSLRSHPSTQPLAQQPAHKLTAAELDNYPVPPAALVTAETETDVPFPTLADGTSVVAHPDYSALQMLRRPFRYRLPDPTRRVDLEYYRDPAHRGYLSYEVGATGSPSLFFAAYEPDVVDGMLQPGDSADRKRVRDDVVKAGRKKDLKKEEENQLFSLR